MRGLLRPPDTLCQGAGIGQPRRHVRPMRCLDRPLNCQRLANPPSLPDPFPCNTAQSKRWRRQVHHHPQPGAISAAQGPAHPGHRPGLPKGNSSRYLLGAEWSEDQPNVAEFFEQSPKFTIRDKGASRFIVRTPWENRLDPDAIQPPAGDELHGKLNRATDLQTARRP